MLRKRLFALMFIVILCMLSTTVMATTYYVATDGDDSNAGTDANYPLATIQEGINNSSSGDTVEVAEGTYFENINFNDKAITVTGTDPNNWETVAATIIDGNDVARVVTIDSGEAASAVLEGFTIQNGNAPSSGGGINLSNSTTVSKCIITGNEGSGITIGSMQAIVIDISDCIIYGNITSYVGGGVSVGYNGNTTLNNCLIYDNQADKGGGIGQISFCTIDVNNCTIVNNTATTSGGGLYGGDYSTYMYVDNSIVWGNTAASNAQIKDAYSATSINYSDVEGGHTGDGNIDIDPNFVDATTDDYHLAPESLCIDAGNNSDVVGDYDIDGDDRVNGVISYNVDMGADEYYVDPPGPDGIVIYVNASVDPNSAYDGTSWADAYEYLQDALNEARLDSTIDEIWVAEGTYYPDEGTGKTNNSRAETFTLVDGVGLYGGFDGTETARSQRSTVISVSTSIDNNKTILSGDIDQNDSGTDIGDSNNSYRVVEAACNAVLDGFTIEHGYQYSTDPGAGLGIGSSADPFTMSNCIIQYNYAHSGAGMYISAQDSGGDIITVKNCVLYRNKGAIAGAGARLTDVRNNVKISGCIFESNSLTGRIPIESGGHLGYGAGMFINSNVATATPTLDNCVFYDNVSHVGAGVEIDENGGLAEPVFNNCVFKYNRCLPPIGIGTYLGGGAARVMYGASPEFSNCIFYDNRANDTNKRAIYCDFGGSALVKNSSINTSYCSGSLSYSSCFYSNPIFLNAGLPDGADSIYFSADDGYNLTSSSPCIDTAHGDYASTYDILGNARYDDPNTADTGTGTPDYADIGAYEYTDD